MRTYKKLCHFGTKQLYVSIKTSNDELCNVLLLSSDQTHMY